MAEKVQRHLFVVSFNFGDNESCIACSFRAIPTDILVFTYGSCRMWEESSILLNPERKYDGFGLDASREYEELKSINESESWWFFRSFSKCESSPDGIVVRDDEGRPFSFESLMVIVLQCMGDKVKSVLDESRVQTTMAEALLVITTPSHWHSQEKGCVYRAIDKTSLHPADVLFISNIEASAICCYHDLKDKREEELGTNQFLVFWDDGVIDVALIGKKFDQSFRVTFLESKKISTVDAIFKDWLQHETQDTRLKDILQDSGDAIHLRDVLHKKLKSSSYPLRIRLSPATMNILKSCGKFTFRHALTLLNKEAVEAIYSQYMRDGFQLIDRYLNNTEYKDTATVFFVGRASVYPFIMDQMNQRGKSVITSTLPESTFAKGSVLYGHYPYVLATSVIRFGEESCSSELENRFTKRVTGRDFLAAVAIDFGTTYSGYAYALRNDPSKIYANKPWTSGEQLLSQKSPTCVLVNHKLQFDSFGYEAEKKYAKYLEEDENDEDDDKFYLFRRFKMELHLREDGLNRDVEITSVCEQKSVAAMSIFSMAIAHLKNKAFDQINETTDGVKEMDVLFLITVPAIWNDSAKQFMKEAAFEAGLEKECVELALEPEAASVWCKHLQLDIDPSGPLSKEGARYMVVDIGGGTVDISVSKKTENRNIEQIHKPDGGAWGGTVVDRHFLQFLDNVFGAPSMARFRKEDHAEYIELLTLFESRKRDDDMSFMVFSLSSLVQYTGEKNVNTNIRSLGLQDHVKLIKSKRLRIESPTVKSWFEGPIKSIVNLIIDLLQKPGLHGIEMVLLVGGFASCKFLKDQVKEAVGSRAKVFIPRDAEIAVLKGAVEFGIRPTNIQARVMKQSYGIAKPVPFDRLRHDSSMKEHGMDVVNVFEQFVEIGERFKTGEIVSKSFMPHKGTNSTQIEIYISPLTKPRYVKERGCKKIGDLLIKHRGRSPRENIFTVLFEFGKTEICVRVVMQHTGAEYSTAVNCI